MFQIIGYDGICVINHAMLPWVTIPLWLIAIFDIFLCLRLILHTFFVCWFDMLLRYCCVIFHIICYISFHLFTYLDYRTAKQLCCRNFPRHVVMQMNVFKPMPVLRIYDKWEQIVLLLTYAVDDWNNLFPVFDWYASGWKKTALYYLTNKIPFLDVYGNINLVVTWSNLP